MRREKPRRRTRLHWPLSGLWFLSLALFLTLTACSGLTGKAELSAPSLHEFLFQWTGEEETLPGIRALLQLASNLTRPRPQLAPYVPIAHTGMCPFGVNTFLEQEVEPWKREKAVRMIAEAGFCWIRQEFPWEDIEISAKGDFWDHRWGKSAWEKYDHIVELAERYGLGLIVRLSNPPAWSRADGDARGSLAPPDDFDDFGDFVYTVVSRYRGRIRYYQIWNEPNIYPEWGEQAVNPEAYTELLKVAYRRAKEADPEVVIISGALAATVELGPRNLNDFIFLQRMYDAGARDYFDIMAVQGYGLWSGPTDRRMRPQVVNFPRLLYIRDIMVKNGDAHKPIWVSEMNWNAIPPDHPAPPIYGRVSEEQQARYAVLAYQRAQQEWPWVGVVNFWFFKRPSDAERDQAWYWFRMVEPDFTPLPVYWALKEYTHRPPVMYPGYHQESHWAVHYQGKWRTVADERAVLGAYRESEAEGAKLSFAFEGSDLILVTVKGEAPRALQVVLDERPPIRVELRGSEPEFGVQVPLAQGLRHGQHQVCIKALGEGVAIDGFIVR